MCFSATASFTAGALLLGVGALSWRQVSRDGDRALALIPVLFAIQQAAEGALWLALSARAPHLQDAATHVYVLFSHVLWPLYVPWAVWLAEPPGPWRLAIAALGGAGVAVGLYLLYGMVANPIVAQVVDGHLHYRAWHFDVVLVTGVYLAATTLAPMLSGHRWVRAFGVLALGASLTAYVLYATWFISVWCYFAALLSALLLLHVRRPARRRAAPEAAPVTPP